MESKNYRISFIAKDVNQIDEESILINVISGLSINASVHNEYFKGDEISFSGNVKNIGGTPETGAIVTIRGYKESKIFEVSSITSSNGEFYIPYSLKFSDPEGIWNIEVEAKSRDGFVGKKSYTTQINVPTGINYYSVKFSSPLKDSLFKRGESIPITVQVLDSEMPVEQADVVIYTPQGNSLILKEVSSGIYGGEYLVNSNDPLGDWLLKAEVSKGEGFAKKVGGANLPITIDSTKINFKTSLQDIEYTNSRLKFIVESSYSDNSPVKGANIIIKLNNGEEINLLEKKDGIYVGEYFITPEDAGSLNVQISAKDYNGNSGILEKTLVIRNRSIVGNILAYGLDLALRYWWAIVLFIALFSYFYRPTFMVKFFTNRIESLGEKENSLKKMQMETEKNYYKSGSISKEEFNKLNEEYTTRASKMKESKSNYIKKFSELKRKFSK